MPKPRPRFKCDGSDLLYAREDATNLPEMGELYLWRKVRRGRGFRWCCYRFGVGWLQPLNPAAEELLAARNAAYLLAR